MSSLPIVLHLGGNGHVPVRLGPACDVIDALPAAQRFELRDVVYPGFAARPSAPSFDAFLETLESDTRGPTDLVLATGIGAMVVLALRARGALVGRDVVLLGPVLWGLEERWFPRLMRIPGVARLVRHVLLLPPVRRRFQRRHFGESVSPELVRGFFDGYRSCRHFADLFHWFTPAYLRRLERDLAARPGALDDIELWWGADDAVVGEREADVTESVLGVRWPRRSFPGWGHYPMIQDPEGFVTEVRHALARARGRS